MKQMQHRQRVLREYVNGGQASQITQIAQIADLPRARGMGVVSDISAIS
jgi:ethanolamine utilization microcompartment shell protein EutS